MCKTIKQKITFRLAPEQVYQLLTNSKLHSALTGRRATISKKVGGTFLTLGGRVTGINVDLVPGKRIVQAWRSKDFPVGIFSMATLLLANTKVGGTQLTLIHRGVPKELIPKVENEWRTFYWEKMKLFPEKKS